MATYYGVNANGNWNTAGTWSTVATKSVLRTGATGAIPTATDICILDDWTSNGGGISITVNATTCKCASLVCTGYAGALVFTANQKLTVSGSVTFTSAMSCTGAGNLTIDAAGTITTGGIAVSITTLTLVASVTLNTSGTTWTNITTSGAGATWTLASALACSGTLSITNYGSFAFAGAFSISCATIVNYSFSLSSLTFVAGQTLTISTSMRIGSTYAIALTVLSSTPSSDTFIHYNGTLANCNISGVIFTDINCAHPVDNWYGGTLTRTTGIYNLTSESTTIPAVGDVKDTVAYGGVDDAGAAQFTGTYAGGGGGVNMPRTRIGH